MNQQSAHATEIVLLSGLLCDEGFWSRVRCELQDLGRISVFSFAGFRSIGEMADHVLAFAPSRFVLIGHSMGGRVALEVFRKAPHRVRALGLFNTGVHPTAESEFASRGRLVALAKEAGMRALAQEWLPPMMDANAAPDPETMARLAEMVERNTPESFEGQIKALLNRPDATPLLASVRIPVLLMSATGDRWSPVAQHEEMRRDIPHAKLAVIDCAGHMAPIEQPKAVAAAMRAWIEGLGDEHVGELERLVIESACIRQINRYARLNDAGDFDELARLYTEDAVFARPTDPSAHIRGRAAIRASLKARPPRLTRHLMAGIEVEVESTTRASARSAVLLIIGQGTQKPATIAATLVGTFDDILENVDGQWLFAQRLGGLDLTG